ncbi:hypothetical protein M426DRAFT_323947 [Hypoxylon sp. CI-4A]|nr:hypothetical protein M426DRAFT_323947 [Hypoxylon sp. CI-4A]
MPQFTDSALFPTFQELPSASSISSSVMAGDWFLLAQIREDMTITKPTVIARDRAGVEFAITFDDGDHRGTGLGWKFRKGHTLVVPRAVRTDREEGKKAVVRVREGDGKTVRIVPGSLEQVFELGAILAGIKGLEAEGEKEKKCAACGKLEGENPLLRCTGCGVVSYCSKACQVRGWNELGHKANCKVLKSIKEVRP